MVGLCQAVLNPVGLADHVEAHGPGVDGVPVPGLLGELDAVVSENGVDLIGYSFEHVLQDLPGCLPVCLLNKLGDSELAGAVKCDEEIQLSFNGLHFCNVDVEEAYGAAPELRPLRLVSFHVRQARDAMALQVRRDQETVRWTVSPDVKCSAERVRCGIDGCRA